MAYNINIQKKPKFILQKYQRNKKDKLLLSKKKML